MPVPAKRRDPQTITKIGNRVRAGENLVEQPGPSCARQTEPVHQIHGTGKGYAQRHRRRLERDSGPATSQGHDVGHVERTIQISRETKKNRRRHQAAGRARVKHEREQPGRHKRNSREQRNRAKADQVVELAVLPGRRIQSVLIEHAGEGGTRGG